MVLRSATSFAVLAARMHAPRTAPRMATAIATQRRFVQTSTNSAAQAAKAAGAHTDANESAGGSEEAPKYKPGWFSRNPGITLGGIVLAIGLYIYRGTRNKKNFDAIQTPIAEAAVISPYEAWELRSANNITYVANNTHVHMLALSRRLSCCLATATVSTGAC